MDREKIFSFGKLVAVLIAFVLMEAGCPSASRMNYEFSPPPSEWIPERSSDGALIFRKENPPMGIMVNTECERYQNVPLEPLSRTLYIGFENRKEVERGTAVVDGNEAVTVVMECTLDGVPLKIKSYTFKAGGCIYDIVYFASPEDFASGLGYFEDFVRSFKTERR